VLSITNNLNNGVKSEFFVACTLYDLWDGPDKFQHISGGLDNNDITIWDEGYDDVSFSFASICDVLRLGDADALPENNGKIEDIQRFHYNFTKNIKCTEDNDKVSKTLYNNKILKDVNNNTNVINSDNLFIEYDVNHYGSPISSPFLS
jgi:hypothetical protein